MENFRRPAQAPDNIFCTSDMIIETIHYIKAYGQFNHEGCVFWYGLFFRNGYVSDMKIKEYEINALIHGVYLANIQAGETSSLVDAEAYKEFCKFIIDYNELGVRFFEVSIIHSHPGRAFHSEADNQELMHHPLGTLSIVVPYYGTGISFNNFIQYIEIFELVNIDNALGDLLIMKNPDFSIKQWSMDEKRTRIFIIPSRDQMMLRIKNKDKLSQNDKTTKEDNDYMARYRNKQPRFH